MKHRVLLIDDQPDRTGWLQKHLRDVEVHQVDTVRDASRKLAGMVFSAVALYAPLEGAHLILPLLFDIREAKGTMLLLYPMPKPNDRATFLNRGFDMCLADDDPAECAAAIRSLLRRLEDGAIPDGPAGTSFVVYKNLTMDPDRQKVTMEGKDVDLTTLEFRILYLLASNPAIIFSRERIYERLWREDADYGAMSVTNYICSIRKKLGLSPRDREYIRTVSGAGYCFGAA